MTVATTLIKEELTGDGVTTTPFTFTFRLLTTDQLDVYVNDVLKTISTDYSVTIDSSGVGGYVTLSRHQRRALLSGLSVKQT